MKFICWFNLVLKFKIVNPNFIQINDIGYSSFISLNSVFSVLKYKFDDITNENAVQIHGGFEKNLESFFLDGMLYFLFYFNFILKI